MAEYLSLVFNQIYRVKKLANIKSQKKRNRQNEKRRDKNSRIKSAIKTSIKKVLKMIVPSPEADNAAVDTAYVNFVSTIDTAQGKGILHKKTAARKKSRIAKKINEMKKVSAG